MKLGFSGQIFEKDTNLKVHENPSNDQPSCMGKEFPDRHDAANRHFRSLANIAYKLKPPQNILVRF